MTVVELLIYVGAIVLGTWAYYSSGRPRKLPDGSIQMRYGKASGVLGLILGILVPLTIVVMAILFPPGDLGDWAAVLGLIGVIGGVGGYYLLQYLKVHVIVNNFGLQKDSLFRTQFCSWTEVQKVYFSNKKRAFIVQDRERNEIRVDARMSGAQEFLEVLEEHLPQTIHVGSRKGYEDWSRRPLFNR